MNGNFLTSSITTALITHTRAFAHAQILALSNAVQDSNILVQRAVLDFLIVCFPLSSSIISKEKYLALLIASLTCVLRRDMSLNRRLYTWLLGEL